MVETDNGSGFTEQQQYCFSLFVSSYFQVNPPFFDSGAYLFPVLAC